MNIPDTTGDQMTIYFLVILNLCFCATLEKQNKQNIIFLLNAVSLFD